MDNPEVAILTAAQMTILADLALDVTGDAVGAEEGRTSMDDVQALQAAKDPARSPMSIRLGASRKKQ